MFKKERYIGKWLLIKWSYRKNFDGTIQWSAIPIMSICQQGIWDVLWHMEDNGTMCLMYTKCIINAVLYSVYVWKRSLNSKERPKTSCNWKIVDFLGPYRQVVMPPSYTTLLLKSAILWKTIVQRRDIREEYVWEKMEAIVYEVLWRKKKMSENERCFFMWNFFHNKGAIFGDAIWES